jgi:type IV secretion system protein VirB11
MNLASAVEPSHAARGNVYLRASLAPLEDLLARAEVTDVYVNRAGEVWVETIGGASERHLDERLDELTLLRLARQIAALSHQGISRDHPRLSAVLPDGARVQVVSPPATRDGVALAIRKQVAPNLALHDYQTSGAFEATAAGTLKTRRCLPVDVTTPIGEGDFVTGLSRAVRSRLNMLVSGGTSSGKTTFLNALLREIPTDERLILIEDTPELYIPRDNAVGLIAVRGQLGEAMVSASDLVSASLRMRPDRIILGELRGIEALAFLRAINSGHPGSMTTIHADSPESAVEQLVLLALEGSTELTRDDVRHYVSETIDVFIQLGRVGGKRIIERVALRQVADNGLDSL